MPTDDNSAGEHSSLMALASHAAGDFPLQTGRMASEKFDNPRVRAEHVTVYTATFIPFALTREWGTRQQGVFFALLWGSHFIIDSRRWNDDVPIWFDQALHTIALALTLVLTEEVR